MRGVLLGIIAGGWAGPGCLDDAAGLAQIAEQLGVSVCTIKRDMAEAYEQCILLTP
ncbi:hypothetical protein [Halopseudomonas maritima]|uniref:hypothetical protein n=1 Tax=Halopseudomonas maritima TaxID=2918528 RepID=UPI001EEC173C|nr:hypothetical protein [Halopseudomonas maritima]UJJ31680.1 hypothetical protein HV822_00385 [Halopseudomonas maritima]